MTKITLSWFQCALCPVEGDKYYILTHGGKKIKVCETCFKKTRRNNENNQKR